MPVGLPAVMRRMLLTGSFLTLVGGLVFLWAHRFERVPGLSSWSLADLRKGVPGVAGVEWVGDVDHPVLKLRIDQGAPPLGLRLVMPGSPTVPMLQLRYSMASRGLIPGPEAWQVGRIMIEWHPPDGVGEIEEDPVGGIKLDQRHGVVTLVAVPELGPARPALRLEHLGLAGEFELADLEITAVRERELWKTGRWVLACGWLFWIFSCIRSWPVTNSGRALAAALIWLLMGIHFVVPGPWKIQKPLVIDFQLASPPGPPASDQASRMEVAEPLSVPHSGAVAPAGKLPLRGALPLRIKLLVAHARPLLHVLLLFGPVLASAWLVGRRPTLILAVLVSLSIEAAQIAFGYGFDWVDVLDLLTDAAGIALGIWMAKRFADGWRFRFGRHVG